MLDFWAENAMLDIGKFEKAFGNFLGAFLIHLMCERMRAARKAWRLIWRKKKKIII